MPIFVAGTDTDVGKTLVCAWLCYHLKWSYFKPIQTGYSLGRDTQTVEQLANCATYPESYCYELPASPHLAAQRAQREINLQQIHLPNKNNLIIEGAGGVLVPINQKHLMIDLISHFNEYTSTPVLLVARGSLGTINHTLLSLQALRARSIPVLGVIMNGEDPLENKAAIEFYGKTQVLAHLPHLSAPITTQTLASIALAASPKNVITNISNNSDNKNNKS